MPKTNTVEFEKDDVKLIETMQKDYVSLQTAIGTIYLRKHQAIQQLEQIENQLSELEVNFTQMRENEQKLLQSLEEKYGKGTIDLSSGKFTPNS
tara:strand:- start:26 stop:307 length:282 start_codon:yes stop_codon:yes gene_type:complete